MQNQKSDVNAKFSKSFWPLAIVVIISMIAGGLIYSFAFNSMLNDDINSMSFTRHKEAKTTDKKTAAPKTTTTKIPQK